MKKHIRQITGWILAVWMIMSVPAAAYAHSGQNEVQAAVTAKEEARDREEKTTSAVEVTADSAVLMDVQSRQILYAKNENAACYPASVTKIMPLLLIMEALDSGKISLTDTVVCSADAAAKGGSQIWLREGESMSVDELLRATAIASANDACCALGELIAGSEEAFVKQMNERAAQLGMENTHFDNCSGLDDDTETHLTTAHDVALMSAELLRHEQICEYSTRWMDSLRDGATQLVNTNKLVRFYEGTTGLKTGTTSKAGCCVSASAKRSGLHLVAVIMGAKTSNDRFEDAKRLLNYGFSSYESVTPSIDGAQLPDVRVHDGKQRYVCAKAGEASALTLEKGSSAKLSYDIRMEESVQAPVEQGQKIGEAVFTLDGKQLCTIPLNAVCAVEKRTAGYIFKKLLGCYSAA